jgi:hypothetical protein
MAKMTLPQKLTLIILTTIALCLCTTLFILSLETIDFSTWPTSTPAPATSAPAPTVPPTKAPLEYRKPSASHHCRQYVKDELKFPESAVFLSERVFGIEGKPNNYHAVMGVVEAKNALGMAIEANYRCDLHYLPDSPGEWVLDGIRLE